ncbi:hypothetical protein V1264_011509 [Littorina saxatilis]
MVESEKKHQDRKRQMERLTGKFQKKLHNRVFSEEEQAENEQLRQSARSNRADGDAFGTLQRKERAKAGIVSRQSHASDLHNTDGTETLQQNATSSGSFMGKDHSQENVTYQRHGMSESRKGKSAVEHNRRAQVSDTWSDQFGTLQEGEGLVERIEESLTTAVGSHEERFSDDEDEQASGRIRLSQDNRRHIPEWYGRQILKLGKHGQIREAIKVFDDWMLTQDRVLPNAYVFTCLITVLGRAGYTKKAFSLFNQMKKMGIEPKPATYTALFNACSNSPWKEDGKARADNLYRLMKGKEVEPTFITGKAMVKAFALCADLKRAFSLMDELSQIYRPDPEAFSFLLMACASDKEEGLRHAIQVWRLMHEIGVQPDLHLYNLLLRCIRDCGVGDVKTFQTLLTGNTTPQDPSPEHSGTIKQIDSPKSLRETETVSEQSGSVSVSGKDSSVLCASTETAGSGSSEAFNFDKSDTLDTDAGSVQLNVDSVQPSSLTVPRYSARIPDILSPTSDSSGIVSLGDLSTRESRLALLGGVGGILTRMKKDQAKPDIITFTQLLTVAMPTEEAEARLLATMKRLEVKPDIDLVNAVIHKRCMRKDFAAAKAAKELIAEYNLTANQMTYGVLAMACKTLKDAKQLLGDMEAADLAPNIEIMGALMYAANTNFHYRLWILQQIQRLDLVPHARILQNIERALISARRNVVEAEKKEDYESYFLSKAFQDGFERFVQHYETWLKEAKLQVPNHPWAGFRSTKEEEKGAASA